MPKSLDDRFLICCEDLGKAKGTAEVVRQNLRYLKDHLASMYLSMHRLKPWPSFDAATLRATEIVDRAIGYLDLLEAEIGLFHPAKGGREIEPTASSEVAESH